MTLPTAVQLTDYLLRCHRDESLVGYYCCVQFGDEPGYLVKYTDGRLYEYIPAQGHVRLSELPA